jgi:two-component system, LuxR family, sensor kinase FixL
METQPLHRPSSGPRDPAAARDRPNGPAGGGPASAPPPDLAAAADDLGAREEALRRRVKELEERSQEAQAGMARYRELFEFAPDCYLVTDLAANILEANHAATVLFGRPREFLVGKPLPFLLPREARPDFYARLARLRREPDWVAAWEVPLPSLRDTPRHAALTATGVGDAGGRPAGLRWLIRDVTEYRRAEEEVREAKAFAEGLIETAGAAVLVIGRGGELLRANAYLEALSGYRREELVTRDWCALLLGGAPEASGADFLRELGVQARAELTRPLLTRDGRLYTVAWSSRRLPSGRHPGAAVLLVGHDITALQEAQRQALALERLAAIGQMAAGLAHESRNALQRSQACLERLSWAVQGQPHAADLVARARKAQEDLLRLYEQVREYAAPLHVDCKPCNLAEVWREAWADVVSLHPARQARLEEELRADDLLCPADCFRLGQVFRNLFDNALAACADPVSVRVTAGDARLGDRPALRVAVRDNGPGLDAEQRRRLFEPFYTTKTRGTGLGMAIVKRIIEAHGGQLGVSDRPPPGAEILITLPRRQP